MVINEDLIKATCFTHTSHSLSFREDKQEFSENGYLQNFTLFKMLWMKSISIFLDTSSRWLEIPQDMQESMHREFKLMSKLANPYLECQTIEAGKKVRAGEVIKQKH